MAQMYTGMPNIQWTSQVAGGPIKVVVYGKAGHGKTRLCATAPGPFILSCEGGLLSIRNLNVPFVEIKSLADLSAVFQWLTRSNEARQNVKTVCLDSLSDIIEVLLNEEKSKTKDPRKAYGEILTKGVQVLRDFRDIPGYNTVLVAKEEYTKDDATGAMHFAPSFPGSKLGQQLPYFPDEVFQACVFADPQTKQRSFWLRCQPDQFNIAKDRSGVLAEFERPDLTYIFNKIAGTT